MQKIAGVVLLMSGVLSIPSHAQSQDGAVRGVVRDPQGAVMPGASVTVRCGDVQRRATTSATGEFEERGLPAVRCSVTASSDVFEPETIGVDARTAAATNLVLQVPRFASEVIVTATRSEEPAFALPEAISVTSRRDIDSRPYSVFPQVLREEPGVLVQQTTSAQTSPSIRGFTGQSNVYLLDGVRLNTASWRSGPSQYLSWVEAGPVDSIEVVRGAGSVQYGSDALGGTIQLLTAPLAGAPAPFTGSAELVAASADSSVGSHAELAVQRRAAVVRFGGSWRRIDDLRAGDGIDSHSALTRFLGISSAVYDSRQPATNFNQTGAYAVADATPGAGTLHALYMRGSQTDASRYDRVLGGEGLYRSGFDPQVLDLGMVRYSRPSPRGVGLSGTFSVNRQADGRFEQARPVARLDRQEAATTAFGYQVQAHHDFASRHQFVAGAELYNESVDAARELVEPTGVITASRPDIPDGTSYGSFGVFAQQTVTLGNRLSVRGGVRFSRFDFSTVSQPLLGVADEEVSTQAVTFQGATVVSITDEINVTGSVTRGFRAPNAADFGSIGLTGGGGFEITPSRAEEMGALVGSTAAATAVSTGTPVSGLQPEVVYQFEVGLKARTRRFSGAVNLFDMELHDFIQRRSLVFPTNVVGTNISGFDIVRQDAAGLAYIAQDVRPIATRVNVDRARTRGLDVEGELRIAADWTAGAYYSLSRGRLLQTGEFLRRMPPPMGGARLRWNRELGWIEGVLTFATEHDRFNSADLADARMGAVRTTGTIATFFNGTASDLGLVRNGILVETGETLAQVQRRVLGGATSAPLFTTQPGYAVIGLRGGVRLTSHFDITAMADNLADRNYRIFGSGIDSPGINLQVRTRYRF